MALGRKAVKILVMQFPGPHSTGDPSMTIDLTDKTAVVTGGSSGIGQAFASTLTASGAKVGITGRDPVRLREAKARCGAAWSLAGNLANLGDRQTLVPKVYSTWPRLDLLINNAGIMLQPNLLDLSAHRPPYQQCRHHVAAQP